MSPCLNVQRLSFIANTCVSPSLCSQEEYWDAQQRDWDDSRTDSVEAFTEDGATELLADFVQQQLEVTSIVAFVVIHISHLP